MRVVIVADFAEASGGAQAVALASAVGLAARGVAVSYIQGAAGTIDDRLIAAGVEVVPLGLRDVWDLPAHKGAAAGIWNRTAARRLRDVLRDLAPGPLIVHLHQWTRALSPSVLPVCLESGHPLVVTLHDYFIACPNGVYYRFERDEPCGVAPLSGACLTAFCDPRSELHKLVRVARTALTRRAIRSAGFDVVHVSDRARDTIAPYLPPGLPQHRIDNPVDAARAEPAVIGPDSKIAFIGRLTREKGADLAAAAGAAVGMPLLFIGEGPAEAEIRRLAPEAEMLGWRSRAETAEILRRRVRAVVAPSRWYETGPLTVYEGLAAGVPAVVSDRAGAAEKVAHGETGLVVAPEIGALVQAFEELKDDAVASRLGAAAHAGYWSAPLDVDHHVQNLLRLYSGIAARKAA